MDLGDVEFGDLSRKKGNDKRARLAGGRGAGRRGRRSRTGQHAVGEKLRNGQGVRGSLNCELSFFLDWDLGHLL